jgi:NitT/TauT family transport system permease protein
MKGPSLRARRIESVVLPAIAAGALVAAWHAAVVLTRTTIVPSPLAVWRGAGELFARGVLLRSIGGSLLRLGAGYGLAVALGVPLGLAMGRSALLEEAVSPVIQVLRPISPLAWIPTVIALMGIGAPAAVTIIFLAAVFPIVVSSASAVRAVPAVLVRAGQNFGLSRRALLARVIFPAALPQLLTGLRVALGVAWIVVVAAEMVAVDAGLGYLVVDARNAGKRYDLVVAVMLIIGAVGLVLDAALRGVARRRSLRWSHRAEP